MKWWTLSRRCTTFPGKPIQVIYDLVYGHSDNQALDLLSRQFFAGPNMYGQDLSHTLPMVRATLLEIQKAQGKHRHRRHSDRWRTGL